MNGIEKITGQIDADIKKEIDALIAGARDEADAVATRYEELAQKEAAAIVERGRKSAAEREDRLVSVARLEAKKQVLSAKQEMVQKAFDAALEQLLNLPEEQYIKFLAQLAVSASTTGHEKVALSQKDRTRIGKQVVTQANAMLEKKGSGAALTLAEETRPIKGGLVVLGDRIEVNCSFETLVRLQQESMTGEVAQELFGNAG